MMCSNVSGAIISTVMGLSGVRSHNELVRSRVKGLQQNCSDWLVELLQEYAGLGTHINV